jgi:hypothetical protein
VPNFVDELVQDTWANDRGRWTRTREMTACPGIPPSRYMRATCHNAVLRGYDADMAVVSDRAMAHSGQHRWPLRQKRAPQPGGTRDQDAVHVGDGSQIRHSLLVACCSVPDRRIFGIPRSGGLLFVKGVSMIWRLLDIYWRCMGMPGFDRGPGAIIASRGASEDVSLNNWQRHNCQKPSRSRCLISNDA